MPSTPTERIDQLETQVKALSRALAELEFLHREIQPVLEQYLERSLLLRSARWALNIMVALGLAIWFGGAIAMGVRGPI